MKAGDIAMLVLAILGEAACSSAEVASSDVPSDPGGSSRRGATEAVAWVAGQPRFAEPGDACLPQTPSIVCNMLRYRLGADDPGPLLQYPSTCVDLPIVSKGACILYSIDLDREAPGNTAFCCDPSALQGSNAPGPAAASW